MLKFTADLFWIELANQMTAFQWPSWIIDQLENHPIMA